MKAWHVYYLNPSNGSLLVFAETAGRAKLRGFEEFIDWDEYIGMRARRAKEWDNVFSIECVIEENRDLPIGTKPFYDDELEGEN